VSRHGSLVPRTRHTLRARLVATVLLLLALACAVIGVATALYLRDFLVERLDRDVQVELQRITGPGPDEGWGPPPGALSGFGRPRGTLSGFVTDAGDLVAARVVGSDEDFEPVPESAYPALLALPTHGPPRTVDLGPLGDYRVAAERTSDGTVLTGRPLDGVDDVVQRLVVIEAGVIGVVLIGAGVTGAALVRRELRPLERVAATAARVSTLPLDRGEVDLADRVPDADPTTEVGQVGTALNRMLDNVGGALAARQESETRLRQFLADASHELRTPLAAIRGYAELSRRQTLPPETDHSLHRISSQADRMTTLVEDMLLLARLDAGRPLDRNCVDLTRLVVDAASDAHAAGPHHHWQLDLPDEPLLVTGDASRLTQVLTNLLANARTHTPPGTTVTTGLTPSPDGVRLTVTDDGPGITPDLLPHVFERFARGSAARTRHHTSTTGSTGLGLAIVDAVVTAHRGHVTVDSRPGRTTFTVTLPHDGTRSAPVTDATAVPVPQA